MRQTWTLLAWAASIAAMVATFQECRAQTGADHPTAAAIADRIARDGAQPTIAKLWRDGQWDGVADHIGSGDAAWIALAPKLAPGADAGPAEDLGIALAYALPRNAPAVLAAILAGNNRLVGVQRVCTLPFIEDSVNDRPAYRRDAIKAVSAVSDPALAGVKGACVSALERSAA